jgi:hypothetical protein
MFNPFKLFKEQKLQLQEMDRQIASLRTELNAVRVKEEDLFGEEHWRPTINGRIEKLELQIKGRERSFIFDALDALTNHLKVNIRTELVPIQDYLPPSPPVEKRLVVIPFENEQSKKSRRIASRSKRS